LRTAKAFQGMFGRLIGFGLLKNVKVLTQSVMILGLVISGVGEVVGAFGR
jgi:hypothetical protein